MASSLDDLGSAAPLIDLLLDGPRDPVHAPVPLMTPRTDGPLRVGIGGPVGSGKTALVDALCKRLRDALSSSPRSPTTSTRARTPSS